jgi:tetratricopeptide (TPR) repeat protein
MKKAVILLLLLMLGMACYARTPTEEECQKEIETALKNIENGKKPLAAADYMSAGTCYDNRKEYNISLDCFMKAAELRVETNDSAGACADYDAVGDTYRTLNDEANAVKYFKISIDFCSDAGLTGRSIARTYVKLGDYENACKYCQINKDYDYCKKNNYCKDSALTTGASSTTSSVGGFPALYLILGAAILLILAAGLFLSKKKK